VTEWVWLLLCLAPNPQDIDGQRDGDEDHGVEGAGQHGDSHGHGTQLGKGGGDGCCGQEGNEHRDPLGVGGGQRKSALDGEIEGACCGVMGYFGVCKFHALKSQTDVTFAFAVVFFSSSEPKLADICSSLAR